MVDRKTHRYDFSLEAGTSFTQQGTGYSGVIPEGIRVLAHTIGKFRVPLTLMVDAVIWLTDRARTSSPPLPNPQHPEEPGASIDGVEFYPEGTHINVDPRRIHRE